MNIQCRYTSGKRRASLLNSVVFQLCRVGSFSFLLLEWPPVGSHFHCKPRMAVSCTCAHSSTEKSLKRRPEIFMTPLCSLVKKKHRRKICPSNFGCTTVSQADVIRKKLIRLGQRRWQSLRNWRQVSSPSCFLVTQVNHFLHFTGRRVGVEAPWEDSPQVGLLSLPPLYDSFTDIHSAQDCRSKMVGGWAWPKYSASVLTKEIENRLRFLTSLPRSSVTFTLQTLRVKECLIFHLFPSRPCCSDIRQGNSSKNFVGNSVQLRLRKQEFHAPLSSLSVPCVCFPTLRRSFGICIDAFMFRRHAQAHSPARAWRGTKPRPLCLGAELM